MENEKWLLALICAASLIGGFATSLKILDGVAPGNASPAPAVTAAKSKSVPTEADLGIEHYYHVKH
jgi:hypothetical protein